jgi:hypothetical protein
MESKSGPMHVLGRTSGRLKHPGAVTLEEDDKGTYGIQRSKE